MYFVSFPVSTTNIFPLANSDCGGQLMSEYNLRSRESVATDPTIEYSVGPSYVHSDDDFSIETANSTTIQINPGRAIVNGHYVELLAPITIDLAAVNYKAGLSNVTPLKGDLAIGLVMMYSTYETIAASALPENGDGYYEGVRVVIVPESSVRRPIDIPKEEQLENVNMHLLLGKFVFYGGTISNVQQNADKLKMYDASRIGNISSSLSDIYLSKEGLDPNKLYVFAGKTSDGKTVDGRNTWCEADDSLMIWDNNPRLTTTRPSASIAHFVYDPSGDGTTKLVLPHKQVDGAINQHGEHVYFPDMQYSLPNATFAENSGGVVNSAYTRRIKHIEDMTNHFYRLPNGKMRAYIPELTISPTDTNKYGKPGALPVIPLVSEYTPEDVSARFQRVYSDMSVVSESLDTIITNIQTINTNNIPGITNNLDTASQNLTNASGKATDSMSVTNQIQSAVHGGASVSTIDGYINDLRSDITNIQNYVGTASSSISSASSIVSGTSSTLISVKTSLDTITSKLSNILANVHSIEDTFQETINILVQKELDKQSVFTTLSWNPGDYVLVGRDHFMSPGSNGEYPSTMYMVQLGNILAIKYVNKLIRYMDPTSETYATEKERFLHTVVQPLSGGVELSRLEFTSDTSDSSEDPDFPDQPDIGVFIENGIDYTTMKGTPDIDYFVVYTIWKQSSTLEQWTAYYYTPSLVDMNYQYTIPPVLVTGGVPFATSTEVGGFLAVSDINEATGKGYVTIDEDGHLRVVDFNLLLLGIQAQQLGQDISIGSGMDSAAINESLEQYVNDRICYPNANQIKAVEEWNQENPTDIKDAHVINLYLELPETTDAETILIHDIGSRANSYLYVHITGSATSSLTVAFSNCDKLRVDSTIQGEPNLVFSDCNLYYDSNVLSRAHSASGNGTGIYNLTLWYEQDIYADGTPKNGSPNLQVDGMTVTLVDDITSAVNVDLWDAQNPNDNHYAYGLRGLTFAGDGTITGMSLLVADRSTTNIDLGTALFRSAFTIPQGQGLSYPENKLRHQLKVTGSFVTCYWSTVHGKFVVKETEFSALSQYYSGQNQLQPGSIGFMTKSSLQSHITGVADNTDTIDCWDLNQMNIFFGGAIN